MIPSTLQPVVNHLWQSTVFATLVGLATLWLRKDSAQTRYWLWLVASAKFLIPLSILVIIGSHFGRHTVAAMESSSVGASGERGTAADSRPDESTPVLFSKPPGGPQHEQLAACSRFVALAVDEEGLHFLVLEDLHGRLPGSFAPHDCEDRVL